MNTLNLEKSAIVIQTFLKKNGLYDFFVVDPNIYIGGSLPFICLSPLIRKQFDQTTNPTQITNPTQTIDIDQLINVGDIDIYTTNCPLLFRNINKRLKPRNIIKNGVNVKFDLI